MISVLKKDISKGRLLIVSQYKRYQFMRPELCYMFFIGGIIVLSRAYYIFLSIDDLVVELAAAFLLGNLFFCLSLLITNYKNIKGIRLFFINFNLFPQIMIIKVHGILITIVYIVFEELFWRGFLQNFLFNHIFSIPLASGLFTLVHYFKFKNERADILSVLEFFLFFLMLSFFFYKTQSIYGAIIIHFIRNIYSEYWKTIKNYNLKFRSILGEEKCIN